MLTALQSAVLDIITTACRAGAPSPTHQEIGRQLRQAGCGLKSGNIGWALGALEAGGHIGRIGLARQTPIFTLPTGERTAKRKKVITEEHKINLQAANARRLLALEGWPVPDAKSIAAYDAAMKRGAPVRIVGRPDGERHAGRRLRPYNPTWSECGSAAELCAI